MQVIRIIQWDRHQHYKPKDGRPSKPPWIKLYRDLLGSYNYQTLSERDRSVVVGMFLLAAETGNKIPYDDDWLKRKLAIKRSPPIEELVARGFIEIGENGSRESLEAD